MEISLCFYWESFYENTLPSLGSGQSKSKEGFSLSNLLFVFKKESKGQEIKEDILAFPLLPLKRAGRGKGKKNEGIVKSSIAWSARN